MVTLYLTPDTPEQTEYHYSFTGPTGEAGLAVVVVVPLDVDAGGNTLVWEYIRLDDNFSIEVVVRPQDVDIISASAATLIQDPVTGAYTGFTFTLDNNNNAAAVFNLSAQIRHSYTR